MHCSYLLCWQHTTVTIERNKEVIIIKYVGSKNKISKYIAPILQKLIDNNNVSVYYEPMCGGLNMIDKIKCKYRIGNDIHPELIAMWKALQSGWKPPEHISEEEYNLVRLNKNKYPDYYVGFVGFMAGYGSKYFGGYSRGNNAKGQPRDIPNEAIRNILKQLPSIQDVKLSCRDYRDINMSHFNNTVIYCDPPYKQTTKYAVNEFDYDSFYDWCRTVAKTNILCVSEYQMPPDFKCIWEKSVTTKLKVNVHESRIEKLFMLNLHKYGISEINI